MQQIETQKSPVLEAVQLELDALPEPKVGDRNVCHFLAADGTLTVKTAPWIDPTTGEQITEAPEWTRFFRRSSAVELADLVANLPDADPDTHPYDRKTGFLRNPLTKINSRKFLPWMDRDDHSLVFEKYVPGIEVSRGRKISPRDNPSEELDDPTDPENLRFFNWGDIEGRVINTIFREIEMSRGGKNMGIVGINFGGTIMMDRTERGLVSEGQVQEKFEFHLERYFPKCIVRSFVFPKAKPTKDAEGSWGLDSSQMEIDFLSDAAIAMTCAWNDLTEEERKVFPGFVISIGTDTCVEAMSLLKTMLGPNCPFSVVAVGAMKPMEDQDSDGFANFKSSFHDLIDLHARGLSVIGLRVEGGLYEPTKTRKVADKLGNSFQGERIIDTEKGETAKTADDSKFRKRKPEDLHRPYTETVAFRGADEVDFIKSGISTNPFRLASSLSNSDAKAFLIGTYASFTQSMKDRVAISRGARGRPIFYVNQILGGSVDQDYEIAKELIKHGVYPLKMTAECARAKLNLAIRLFGDNHQKIIDYMTKSEEVEGLIKGVSDGVDNTLGSGI